MSTRVPPPYASPEEAVGAVDIAFTDIKQLIRVKPGMADIPMRIFEIIRREMEAEDPDLYTARRLADLLQNVRQVDWVRAMCHIAKVGYDKDHKAAISFTKQLGSDLSLEAIRCFLMLDTVNVQDVYRLLDRIKDVNEQFRIYHQLYPHETESGKLDVLSQMRNLADRTHNELLPHVTWSMVYERSGEDDDLKKVLACLGDDGDPSRHLATHVRIFRASGLYKDWLTMIDFMDHHASVLRTEPFLIKVAEATYQHLPSLRHDQEHRCRTMQWLERVFDYYNDPISLIQYYRAKAGLGNPPRDPNNEENCLNAARLCPGREYLLGIEDPELVDEARLQFIHLLADLGKPVEARKIAQRMSPDNLLELVQAYCEVVRAKRVKDERQSRRDSGT